MPMLIKHIDAIAREKQRDVLFVFFHKDLAEIADFEHSKIRNQLITWLDANEIGWQPCGHIASENSMVGYMGQIYIDAPFDESDERYRKVRNFLENPDGTMKHADAAFCYLPLDRAMKNAHHDEPGFWGKWAEDF